MNKEELKVLLDYIEQHINEKIYLDELSKLAGYSPFYFSRLFSEIMGTSVTTYIRVRKLQYAMMSLIEGKKVIDVSNQYAFESHEGFTRSFSKLFGSSPKTVRKYLAAYSVPEYVIPGISSRKDGFNMKKEENLLHDMHEIVFSFIQESVEEAKSGYCTDITIKLLPDNIISICDNGRGLPLSDNKETNQQIFTRILAGAPITRMDYNRMEDIHDINLQIANSLCEFLQVTVYKSNQAYMQKYVRGIAQQEIICKKTDHISGMCIELKPDKRIFADNVFSKELIESWIRIATQNINCIKYSVLCEK